MNLKDFVAGSLHNLRSFHTSRKIVVFQSDDWGAIRTPSRQAFDALVKRGIPLNHDIYSCNDALESRQDLERMFEVLSSVKDCNGHPANFTANYVVANPDFERIKADGFERYYYEPINETYKRYYGEDLTKDICAEAMASGIWTPQSHGREHLNVALWMKCLQDNIPEIRLAFEYGMFALTKSLVKNMPVSFMEAFNARSESEEQSGKAIITDALKMFGQIFGYQSGSFIAPNYVWGNTTEKTLSENGVQYIQSGKVQRSPIVEGYKIVRRHTGEQNDMRQTYIARNCNFEPTTGGIENAVDNCLAEINNAFLMRTPAIVNSHRINYIGGISKSNSSNNLKALKKLLSVIVKKWPAVEFIDSVNLGNLIYINYVPK